MERKKLHMGTMSYGPDSMDEVAHQLAVAFGISGDHGESGLYLFQVYLSILDMQSIKASLPCNGG
jgi:hypothetical protein